MPWPPGRLRASQPGQRWPGTGSLSPTPCRRLRMARAVVAWARLPVEALVLIFPDVVADRAVESLRDAGGDR
eukprot:2993709-Pyramimonas_sp.AAC.1